MSSNSHSRSHERNVCGSFNIKLGGELMFYDKGTAIDYIWQYSKFYGNQLFQCERHFSEEEGYVALVLLFDTTENICKSIIGNYESSFYNIVNQLKEKDLINEQEQGFLSTNELSLRTIRNLFAHANLMSINLVQLEGTRDIYYPLTEEGSCLLLYEKISDITINILLKIVQSHFIVDLDIGIEHEISELSLRIENLSAEETLKLMGWESEDIDKVKEVVDENQMQILADNSSNIDVLKMFFENLKE